MKFCPMCGTSQSKAGVAVCELCGYEEKPLSALTQREIYELMAPYEYEKTEDGGVRINAVKNVRDLALRGAVHIPHFVTEIGRDAFSHCKFLARIDLPRGLRSIGDSAFAQCRDLFDVFIPESVRYIGRGAFSDCYDLGVVCAEAPEQPDGWDREWLAGCQAKVAWSSTDEE